MTAQLNFLANGVVFGGKVIPSMQAIALCKTNDPSVLIDDDKVASIAEGYANAGIHLLAKRLLDTGIDELEEAAVYMSDLLQSVESKELE